MTKSREFREEYEEWPKERLFFTCLFFIGLIPAFVALIIGEDPGGIFVYEVAFTWWYWPIWLSGMGTWRAEKKHKKRLGRYISIYRAEHGMPPAPVPTSEDLRSRL